MTSTDKFREAIVDIADGDHDLAVIFAQMAKKNGYVVPEDMPNTELEKTIKQFTSNVALPAIGRALSTFDPKKDSSEWKHYSAMAERASKYAEQKEFNRSFEQLKKQYGEDTPLLKLANDDAKISVQAALQGTTPENLKNEINNAWEQQQKKIANEAEKSRISETEMERARLWRDFQEGRMDKEVPVIGLPLRFVASHMPGNARIMEGVRRNVLAGTDEGMVGDLPLKDAGVTAAIELGKIYAGGKIGDVLGGALGSAVKGGIGRLSEQATRYAASNTGRSVGQGIGFGLGNFAGQYVDNAEGRRNGYDIGAALAEGGTAAAVGGVISHVVGKLSRMGAGPVSRLLSRRFRRIGGEDPVAVEQAEFATKISAAREAAKKASKNNLYKTEAELAAERAAKYKEDPILARFNEKANKLNAKEAERIAQEKKAARLAERSKDIWTAQKVKKIGQPETNVSKSDIKISHKRLKDYPDKIPTRSQFDRMTDKERLTFAKLYPEHYGQFLTEQALKENPPKLTAKIAVGALEEALRSARLISAESAGKVDYEQTEEYENNRIAREANVSPEQAKLFKKGWIPLEGDKDNFEAYERYLRYKK